MVVNGPPMALAAPVPKQPPGSAPRPPIHFAYFASFAVDYLMQAIDIRTRPTRGISRQRALEQAKMPVRFRG
jgi:hypothetical protein